MKLLITVILPVLFFLGCSLPKTQGIDTAEAFYRHGIKFKAWCDGSRIDPRDRQSYHVGVATFPACKNYEFKLYANGEMDLAYMTNCNQSIPVEDAGSSHTFEYRPSENTELCDVKFQTFEKILNRHEFGFVSFEHKFWELPFQMECNGKTYKANGVDVCQAQVGLIQFIKFDQPVDYASQRICDEYDKKCKALPKKCAVFKTTDRQTFEMTQAYGRCRIVFINESGETLRGKLTTIGWEKPTLGDLD